MASEASSDVQPSGKVQNPAKDKGYKATLNLPRTSFEMEAKLVHNEPPRLKQWQDERLYEKLLAARASSPKGKWILHDGPPFANGDIHIGHVINKTLKDIILRFRSMEGYETPYVPGWDCHGLPIEHKIQEQFKGKLREMSTAEVRRHCYEYAEKYARVQSEQFQRLGILGEWSNPYLTMSGDYEAETLEVFARFVEAGLVYKQLKPVPWSVANQTALADAELEYQDVEDPSIYVEFPVAPGSALARRFDTAAYLLVWTTTPWTLPANLAIAVHSSVQYACVEYMRAGERRVGIVAQELREAVLTRGEGISDVKALDLMISGEELVAEAAYSHPFIDYEGRILAADYVTTTDGTGLVHTAPGHGEEDYETGMKNGLRIYSPVLHNGRFDDTVPEFLRGKTTKESNGLIIDELRRRGRLFAVQNIVHSYPHDWRSKTPIIFRATEQWFIAIDKPFLLEGEKSEAHSLRDRAKAASAAAVEFIPAWGQQRLLGMLESRPDWCISRQRSWGLPIPVFYDEKGGALLTPGSVRAVARHFREKGSAAWFTDTASEMFGCEFACPPEYGDVSKLRKEQDIFDVWFESGSSWRAVLQCRSYLHYPADLYLEGSDQHRGWFQLSLLPALGATGKPPYKQVLTHGFVVKPDGTKVSKSDKEYVKAVDEINRHGADVLRLWCSSVDYQNDIPTSPQVIKEFGDKYRKIRNTLRYLISNLFDFDPRKDAVESSPHSLDGWALHELDELIAGVRAAYDAYQLHRAFRLLHDFCAVQMSAIYGSAMKDRLYCDLPGSAPRRRSQTAMHRIVLALTKLLAPMLVFTADEAWEHIEHKPAADSALDSVHLALLPEPSGQEVGADQKSEWELLMKLRDEATMQLDRLKKEVKLNKALDAEAVFEVDAAAKRMLEFYGADLEDLLGAGYHSFVEKPAGAAGVSVRMVDRRETYAACARSWKRRPDVGKDSQYPDLSLRDAAAVRGGISAAGPNSSI